MIYSNKMMAQNQEEEGMEIKETGDLIQERGEGRYSRMKLYPRSIRKLVHVRVRKRHQENFLHEDKIDRNKYLERSCG